MSTMSPAPPPHPYLKEALGPPAFRLFPGKRPWTDSLAGCGLISALDSFGCVPLGRWHPLSEPTLPGGSGL